jgi:Flp pilus assembly protein TadD
LWDARDGRLLAPLLPAGGVILNVLLTPQADHLVAGGFLSRLRVWHLGDFDEKDDFTADEMCLLAEVVSRETLLAGGTAVAIEPSAWLERHRRFRSAHPLFFEPDRGDPRLAARLSADRAGRHEREHQAADRDGQFGAALYHLDRWRKEEPNEPSYLTRRLPLLLELGRWEEARAAAEALERNRPGVSLLALCALAHLRAGDEVGYRRACASLVARYGTPKDFPSLRDLTLALVAGPSNKVDRPIALLQEFANRNRGSCAPRHVLGAALCRAGRHEEAVRVLEQALRFHPGGKGELTDLVFLALAHHKLGNAEQARGWLARANRSLADPAERKRAPLRVRLVAAQVRGEVAAAVGAR